MSKDPYKNPYQGLKDEELEIDLFELWDAIVAKRKFIGKCTAVCVAVAALYCIVASPVYESESLIRIKQDKGIGASLLENAMGGNVQLTQQQMMTYAEILKSRSVVEPTIKATQEAKDGKYPLYEAFLKARIKTEPYKNTELLKITANANTPEDAQKLNNALLDSFLAKLVDMTNTQQRATREFLGKRTEEAKEELTKAEAALSKFQQENKVFNPSESVKLLSDRLALVEKTAAENEIARNISSSKLDAINGQLSGDAAAIADNTKIKNIQKSLTDLEVEYVGNLNKYTKKHPRMIELQEQIAKLKTKMAEETQKVANMQAPSDNAVHQGLLSGKLQSEAELAVANNKKEALDKLRKQNDADLERLPELEKAYATVKRDADVANELYVLLAKRYEESKVAAVISVNDVQIVDRGNLPDQKSAPKRAKILIIATLLGALLSSGFAAVMSILNRRVRTEDDVLNYLNIPVLGNIPDENSLQNAIDRAKSQEKENGLWAKCKRFFED